jgi:lactate permease
VAVVESAQGLAVGLVTWLIAALPVLTLFGLVLSGKVKTSRAAVVVVVLAAIIAAAAFGAGPRVLAVGALKGAWLGTWILLVVWPALLLYRLAERAGMERIGQVLRTLLPAPTDRLLALAWVVPSLIQGVAGFGTPIAVVTPLLVSLGYPVRRALLYSLVGYHWSVTFGSMGSSFYMASLTAGLTGADQELLALRAAIMLGVNCLAAGALVLLLDGGVRALREGALTLVVVGGAMATTLVVVATIVPALGSLSAGTAGIVATTLLTALRRRRSAVAADGALVTDTAGEQESGPRELLRLLAPYLILLATALPVLGIPATRAWARAVLVLGPSFPATTTAQGWSNEAVAIYTPLAVGAHPGFYLFVGCFLGYLAYRRTGLLAARQWRPVADAWVRSLPKASWSVWLLAMLATVMTDTGMVQLLAEGVAAAAGDVYPVVASTVGAVGSFMTGSTTASNALFAGFQLQVARFLGLDPTILIAAQTAGGNVGNAVAPVVILVGLSAVGDADELSGTLRSALPPILVLLAIVTAMTGLMLRLA